MKYLVPKGTKPADQADPQDDEELRAAAIKEMKAAGYSAAQIADEKYLKAAMNQLRKKKKK